MGSNDQVPPSGPRAVPRPRLAAAALPEAYVRAQLAMASDPPAVRGYRLFWVCGRKVDWMDLPVGGDYAIIGQHARCDAVLSHDQGISLRHLLATTIELADGIALRLLDLQARVPFYLADDVPRRAVVACGAIAVRLSEHVIGGFPVEPSLFRPAEPTALPHLVVTDSRSLPESADPVLHDSPPIAPRSRVYSMPPPPLLSDLPRTRSSQPSPAVPFVVGPPLAQPPATPPSREDEGPLCARLTLRRGEQTAAVELAEGDLDIGVIVGRSSRGAHPSMQAVLDTKISRGHLLLLHHHGVFEAFDLCSTQGTYCSNHKSVRRFVLPDGGATLHLAAIEPLTLEWQRM